MMNGTGGREVTKNRIKEYAECLPAWEFLLLFDDHGNKVTKEETIGEGEFGARIRLSGESQ